ncbi:MAG: hypothetical protein LBI42_05245 [Chitinispirillales bacterium]|jgi:hypothetical protein|nr:hypothetical protein [Chitinispirillales bacterium]
MDKKKASQTKPTQEYPEIVKYRSSDVQLKGIIERNRKKNGRAYKLSNMDLITYYLKET